MAGAIGQKAEKEEGKNVYSVGGEGKKKLYLVWREMIFLLIPTNGTENKIKR